MWNKIKSMHIWNKIQRVLKTFFKQLFKIILDGALTILVVMTAMSFLSYILTYFAVSEGITTEIDNTSLLLFIGFPGLFVTILVSIGVIWILKKLYSWVRRGINYCFRDTKKNAHKKAKQNVNSANNDDITNSIDATKEESKNVTK